jgi:DNA topoisomerase IB
VGLRRVSPAQPGIIRRRRGRGFSYVGTSGESIRDPETLHRIRTLAIPPAWTDVWICESERGHLQAVGTDAAGRRQYRYHEEWQRRRQRQKFDRMLDFARALPGIRDTVDADLADREVDRRRALAAGLRLLDLGFFRIGSEAYAEANGSFGLATILRRHVKVRGEVIVFDYVAKGGQRRVQEIRDAGAARAIRSMKARRGGGRELLAYREEGRWRDVRSIDINGYLRESAGMEATAKDFRTWHATVLSAIALARTPAPETKTGKRRAVREAISEVSEYLGNTPAVCRTSYIDPRVVDRFWDGHIIQRQLLERFERSGAADRVAREAIEAAVVDLIEDRESPAVAEAA